MKIFSRRPFTALLAAAAIASVGIGAGAPAQAVEPTPKIMVGAVGNASDVTALGNLIGAPLAWHGYSTMEGSVPRAPYVNMRSTASWPAVAAAAPGSTIHANIVRWADTLKARPGTILFTFHHEPEASTSDGMGTSDDYVAAYRKVVDIFRAQGVTNVEYTWQMTSWAFSVNPLDRRAATKWYPGDDYVTNVGVDPYNWWDCGTGATKWNELQTVMDSSLVFSRARGKKLVVAEFASDADARRATWLRNATAYFIANRDTIRGVFYFQYTMRPQCSWLLTSPQDLAAFGDMAKNSTYFSAS